jgi:hypothetical protein
LLSNTDDHRTPLLVSALRLSYFTVGWNGIAGASALVASIVAGSPALAAFALNALLDSSASLVLVWRFRTEQRDRLPPNVWNDGRTDGSQRRWWL